jgi:Mrp family chromosome partitioning ATPase
LESEEQQLRVNYQTLATNYQQVKIEEELESGKLFNIVVVQQPTPPSRDFTKTNKAMAIAAVGGIALGLALAFLMELYLDRSVKRPKEVEAKLGLRLFLSIPDITRNGHRRLAKSAANNRMLLKDVEEGAPPDIATTLPEKAGDPEVALWDPSHALHPYYEALKDRLVGYFEVRNLTHKPKLVAVTGAGRGSGATTMAVGLAASLSETGDGNVLLVDMNLEHGAAQQFFKGKPCGLDEALTHGTRDNAMVQDNLYVVSGGSNGDKLPRILPKRFASLLPKLKASDFDYIIFDMPPISETSVTLRLAGYMDMVMLVVESEKTDRELVQRASSLLAESKANVSVLLNKTRRYVPASLQQEF